MEFESTMRHFRGAPQNNHPKLENVIEMVDFGLTVTDDQSTLSTLSDEGSRQWSLAVNYDATIAETALESNSTTTNMVSINSNNGSVRATRHTTTNLDNKKDVGSEIILVFKRFRNLIHNSRYSKFQIISRFLILYPLTLVLPIWYTWQWRSLILTRPYFELEVLLLCLSTITGPAKEGDLKVSILLLLLIGLFVSLYMEFLYIFFVGWLTGKCIKLVNEIFELDLGIW